mgnify:CR=1 FL=1
MRRGGGRFFCPYRLEVSPLHAHYLVESKTPLRIGEVALYICGIVLRATDSFQVTATRG